MFEKILEISGNGVLEYWIIGVLKKQGIDPLNITPTLHYSSTPKLIGIKNSRNGMYSLGFRSNYQL